MKRIFREKLTIEDLDRTINKYMEEGFTELNSKSILEKWNYFSVLELENEESKRKLLELVEYIDQVIDDEEMKISEILTLNYIIVKNVVNINQMDKNSVFLVINYLNDKALELVDKYIPFIFNDKLLFSVRTKTLDLEVRVKLLDYVLKHFRTIQEMIDFIEKNEYYDMLEIIG